jgi:hypothetical protein
MIWPSAVTISMPETAVERLPFLMPEPWVAVAQAPTAVMWGSEARLWRAKPCCVDVGREDAVGDSGADGDGVGGFVDGHGVERLSEIWAWVLSAMVLKEWRLPRARSLGAALDDCWTSATVLGW